MSVSGIVPGRDSGSARSSAQPASSQFIPAGYPHPGGETRPGARPAAAARPAGRNRREKSASPSPARRSARLGAICGRPAAGKRRSVIDIAAR